MMCRVLLGTAVLLGACGDGTQEKSTQSVQDIPSRVELEQAWFHEVAEERGIDFKHESGATGLYNIIETISGGAALFDYDDDGDLDLYIVQGNLLDGSPRSELVNRLYENTGDGQFVDRTEGSGAGDARYGIGVTTGDYDNDGDVDLYVTNYGSNSLLRNEGQGRFTDVTQQAGVGGEAFSACASFGDVDLDGDLDLFVSNYLGWTPLTERACYNNQSLRDYCNPMVYEAPVPDVLYINQGDGVFRDVSVESGIASVSGTGLGVVIAPITSDVLPDIFVANDGMPDRLWVNMGDGTFQEQGMTVGCALDDSGKAKAGMGVELVDLDRDGDLDLLVTNLFSETDSFYINQGDLFVDASARWGLSASTRNYTRWGVAVEDFDNDGLDDLYEATGRVNAQTDLHDENDPLSEPNLLLRQIRPGRFAAVVPSGGTSDPLIATAHGLSAGDINGDGGIDLVVVNKDAGVHLLENVVGHGGNWIVLDVRNEYGSPALGALVDITMTDGGTWIAVVRSARGYASAHDPRIHIGLGEQESLESVRVRWPDGREKVFDSLSAGEVHRLAP